MGWIEPNDRMPPEGLEVLLEISGQRIDEHDCVLYYDHSYVLGTWLLPVGEEKGRWLIHTESELLEYSLVVHAWMPLPKHYAPREMFNQEPDLMEHAIFEEEPEWLYKGDAVFEQIEMVLE